MRLQFSSSDVAQGIFASARALQDELVAAKFDKFLEVLDGLCGQGSADLPSLAVGISRDATLAGADGEPQPHPPSESDGSHEDEVAAEKDLALSDDVAEKNLDRDEGEAGTHNSNASTESDGAGEALPPSEPQANVPEEEGSGREVQADGPREQSVGSVDASSDGESEEDHD